MRPLGIILLIFCFMAISGNLVLAQEQITITTYYPSPYGSYADLTVTKHLEVVGSVNASTPMTNAKNEDAPGFGQTRYTIRGYIYDTAVYGALGRSNKNLAGTVYKYAVYGREANHGGGHDYAGYFDGDVKITGDLEVTGGVNSSFCRAYTRFLPTTSCASGYYTVACGRGNCTNPGNLANPTDCPLNGYLICVKHGD